MIGGSKMKKYIVLTAVISFLAVGHVQADYRNVPRGPDSALGTSDYGGVDRSTISLSSGNVLCFTGPGVVLGFLAPENSATTDYLLFGDTESLKVGGVNGGKSANVNVDVSTAQTFAKVFLSSGPTGVNAEAQGSYRKFPAPIRVYRGLVAKCNVNTVEIITILWTKFNE